MTQSIEPDYDRHKISLALKMSTTAYCTLSNTNSSMCQCVSVSVCCVVLLPQNRDLDIKHSLNHLAAIAAL